MSQITDEEYLIPCLLPVTEDPSLFSPSSSVPSLLFYLPHSPLVGVFCGLAAYLLSWAKWKLLFDASSQCPAKVGRNTIEFEVPGDRPGRITLTDLFSTYFQVSIQLPAAIASELSPEVLSTNSGNNPCRLAQCIAQSQLQQFCASRCLLLFR